MKLQKTLRAGLLLALLFPLHSSLSTAQAQGTAFTYQGQLHRDGAPADGTYDFRFQIYDSDTGGGGTRVAGPLTNSAVAVSNGLFTTTLDFGTGVFDGNTNRWLQIGVHTNGASGWAALSPRQQIAPAPYAIMANTADTLTGGPYNTNAGTLSFLGSGNGNEVQGGGSGTADAVIVGGYQNQIQEQGSYSAIGGGSQNKIYINTIYSAIGGGSGNKIQDTSGYCVIGGGTGNSILPESLAATIPGGAANEAGGQYSFAAGHEAQATNNGSFVWADSQNAAFSSTNNDSFNVRAQGGARFFTGGAGLSVDGPINGAITVQQNSEDAPNVVEGSSANSVSSGVIGATIGGGGEHGGLLDTNRVTGDFGTVSGGTGNTAGGYYSTVSGGRYNTAGGYGSSVGGGGIAYFGSITFAYGGNNASGSASVIGGGVGNIAGGILSTVPGGQDNSAGGEWSFAAGQRAKAVNQGTFVWADSQNSDFSSTAKDQFSVRAQGGVRFETSGAGVTVDGHPVWSSGGSPGFESGQAVMSGGSSTSKTNLTITFSKTFTAIPKVIATVNADPAWNVDDTFVVSVRNVSTTGCAFNIVRVDAATGWSQKLRVNWIAWQ